MHYFVSGGAGFIGSNFVELLFSQAEYPVSKVTVFDKVTYSGNMNNLKTFWGRPDFNFVNGDICDFDLLSSVMSDVDYVIHFAAESHVDNSIHHAGIFVKTNVLGTQQLLEASRKNRVKRFLNVSTDEVYGSILSGVSTEESNLHPNSPYSASKAGSDLICRSYFQTYSFDVITTRASNNYGKHQHHEKLIPRMVERLKNGESIPLYGTGLNMREWIHVSDHCRAIFTLVHNGVSGEIYNIGSGCELSNIQVAKKVLEVMSLKEDRIEFVEDRLGHDFRYRINSDKLKELGFVISVEWEKGIEEYIEWHLSNPNHWSIK
jgi:dTDP-glucose 4,6-dehydratase